MLGGNAPDIRCFVVVGRGDASMSRAADDALFVIGSGLERRIGGAEAQVQMEFALEPGTPGSRFAGRLTRALVYSEDDLLICYDLSSSEMTSWLSGLRSAGFAVFTQPYSGTGRQLGVCTGKGRQLAEIDWLEHVLPFDSTFLSACRQSCAELEHAVRTGRVADIHALAVGRPEELWDVIGCAGLVAFVGGDEGDFFVVRARGMDASLITEALLNVARELGSRLYDAGSVSGWDARALMRTNDVVKDSEWYPVPPHWHSIVDGPGSPTPDGVPRVSDPCRASRTASESRMSRKGIGWRESRTDR